MHLPLRLLGHLPIRTERLLLTSLDATWLDALAAMLADPVVMTYFPRPMTRPESEYWLRRNTERYELHGTALFAVLREQCGGPTFLGDCGLVVRRLGGQTHLELGYHFAAHAWGQGYATEAARACLALGFRHTTAPEIIALIRPENLPSRRVAQRLGMRVCGAVLHAALVHDVWSVTREQCAKDTLQ
jgi:RimJ/RimL family protein N-acetyltransferase